MNHSLLKLFAILWAVAVLHLHGLMHSEVWPHGVLARILAAAPPIAPVVQLALGNGEAAALTWSATLMASLLWSIAARRPGSKVTRAAARIGIVAYWLLLWFPMALSA